MTAPRAMTAAVIGLPTKSQGAVAFLRRQRRPGAKRNACGRATWTASIAHLSYLSPNVYIMRSISSSSIARSVRGAATNRAVSCKFASLGQGKESASTSDTWRGWGRDGRH